MCKVRGMTTSSHECLAVCLGLAEEDFSENCTTWCQILLVQILAFKSGKTNIKEPQGCFRVRPRNAHVKRQFNFVKRHTTMNLPKTWWTTIQGSRLSSSQRRTCFPKTQARKGPSSNRANLHLELPGRRQKHALSQSTTPFACTLPNRMGGFRKGGSRKNRFVLKLDVTIASEVSNSSKHSLAITDLYAKRTKLANYCGKRPSWNPPIRDLQFSEGTITRVSCNQTLAQKKKGPSLEVFCLYSCA